MGHLPTFATSLANPAFACLWKFRPKIPVEPALNFRSTSLLSSFPLVTLDSVYIPRDTRQLWPQMDQSLP